MGFYTKLKSWLGYIELENLSTGKLLLLMLAPLVVIIAVITLANVRIGSVHIKSLVIRGNKLLTDSALYKILPGEMIGKRAADINPEKIENELKMHGTVKTAYVESGIDGKLRLDLFERKPIALVNLENGDLKFIDDEGILFSYVKSEDYKNLPLISMDGIVGDTVIIREAAVIIQSFISYEGGILLPYLSQLIYDRKSGIFEFISNDNGKRIILGRRGDITEKLEKFMMFKESVLNRTESDKFSFVDLRWKGKIITGKL